MPFIDFQELKERVDIESVCSFLQLDLKNNGKQMRGACPACSSNSERSFVVTPAKGLAYCFSAKTGGDVIWLTSHIKDCSQKEAAEILNQQFGEAVQKENNSSKKRTAPSSQPKERGIQPLSYLQTDCEKVIGLGVLPDTAEYFEAGYASKGIMRGTLAIPIHSRDNVLLAYAGRAFDSQLLTFPNGFKPEEHIFNAHRICEGDLYLTRDPLEVLIAYENGVENVVSFLTETIQAIQLEMLASLMDQRGCDNVEMMA